MRSTRAQANWRSNLLCRTPAQKDFHCTRAKRTGEAIGARGAAGLFCKYKNVGKAGLKFRVYSV